MSYQYETQRAVIFTDAGQRMFLKIRDHAKELLETAGAATSGKLSAGAGGGDTWDMLACIDRLVELGELRRITPIGSVPTQNEVFVAGRHG